METDKLLEVMSPPTFKACEIIFDDCSNEKLTLSSQLLPDLLNILEEAAQV